MRSIKISEDAYLDIEEIFACISQDNKTAAKNLRQKIYEEIKGLKDFPFKYPMLQEDDAPGAERGYRYMVINPHIVFYRVLDDTIIIARVRQTRQNWRHLLFGSLMNNL
jgi:toxin ParE1/3/4